MKGQSLYIPSYLATPLVIENNGETYSRLYFEDTASSEKKGAISVKNSTSQMYFRNYTINEDGTNEGSYTNYFLPTSTYIAAADASASDHTDVIITRDTILDQTHPVGSCFITSTRTDPATILGGGTWSLINKSFTSSAENGSSFFTVNSTNATFVSCYIKRSGNVIQIRLSVKPKVNFGDDTVKIGTLNFNKIGITGLNATQYILGASDGGGGISECTLHYETGVLNHMDTVHRSGSGTAITSTSYEVLYDFIINAT